MGNSEEETFFLVCFSKYKTGICASKYYTFSISRTWILKEQYLAFFIGCHSKICKHLLANLITLHFIVENLELARLTKKLSKIQESWLQHTFPKGWESSTSGQSRPHLLNTYYLLSTSIYIILLNPHNNPIRKVGINTSFTNKEKWGSKKWKFICIYTYNSKKVCTYISNLFSSSQHIFRLHTSDIINSYDV